MYFTILCLDKTDALPRRLAAIDAHRAYLAEHRHPVDAVISGPLVQEADGQTMKGSFFLVDAPNRAAIEAWQAEDPLASADVWEQVIIEAFNKRVDKLSGGGA